jgi:hypothetical protein
MVVIEIDRHLTIREDTNKRSMIRDIIIKEEGLGVARDVE